MSAKDTQIGGDHYKRMSVEPWAAMESWLTPKEYRGYLKGTAIAYLARDGDKPETDDIGKAHHVLEHYLEVRGPLPEETPAAREEDPPLLVTNPLPPLPEGVDLAALAPKLRTGKL